MVRYAVTGEGGQVPERAEEALYGEPQHEEWEEEEMLYGEPQHETDVTNGEWYEVSCVASAFKKPSGK